MLGDENDKPQYAVPTAAAIQSPKVPNVRTTLSSEDLNKQRSASTRSSENTNPIVDASPAIQKRKLLSEDSQPKQCRQNTHDILMSALKARKFHLLRNPAPISSPFLLPKTIAQKHRNKRKKDLAVFAERPEITLGGETIGYVSKIGSGEPRQTDNDKPKDSSQLEQPHKRPKATAAELKWRTETWANRPKRIEVNGHVTRAAENINKPSGQRNDGSARLAEQMQRVALDEIRACEERARALSGSEKFKLKPKPPESRQSKANRLAVNDSEGVVMTNTISIEDDSDYVLDTYVRSSEQPFEVTASTELHHESLHGIDHGNIGIIVIEDEEDEARWEAFAEDQESDREWNSEEEDENGLWIGS